LSASSDVSDSDLEDFSDVLFILDGQAHPNLPFMYTADYQGQIDRCYNGDAAPGP